MKPAWDKLGSEFKESDTVLIADVDCTVYRSICDKYGVKGFPSIKYFNAGAAADGDSYDGGRDYDSLKKFADENLGAYCSDKWPTLCNEEQKAILRKYRKMSKEEREEIVKGVAVQTKGLEDKYADDVKQLQATYDGIEKTKAETLTKINNQDLTLLKGSFDQEGERRKK